MPLLLVVLLATCCTDGNCGLYCCYKRYVYACTAWLYIYTYTLMQLTLASTIVLLLLFCVIVLCMTVQPLFRKLATALPGMESAPLAANSNLIDIKLSATPAEGDAAARRCGC
jgi:hypothetical protein